MSAVIRDLLAGEGAISEEILRALPEWFGIESSLLEYVRDTARYPTWVAELSGAAVGFITMRQHFPQSAEVHCLAVRPEHHRTGVGRALLEHVEGECRRRGVTYLQVKTLGPSRPCAAYGRTRYFYEAMGFVALEEFASLWPGNPCLLMTKRL